MRLNKSSIINFIYLSQIMGYPIIAGIGSILDINSSPISIVNRASVLILSLISILFFFKKSNNNLILKVGTAFWIIYLLRLAIHFTFYPYDIKHETSFYLIWGIGGCFIPFLSLSLGFNSINPKKIFLYFIFLAFTAFLVVFPDLNSIVMSKVTGHIYSTGRLSLERLNSISVGNLGNIISLPSYWALLNPAFISKFNFNKFFLKSVLFINLIFGLVLIIGSASRGPISGFIITILLLELMHQKLNSYSFLKKIGILFSLIFIIIIRFSNSFQIWNLLRIFSNALNMGDYSSQGRISIYLEGINNFKLNPFFGKGIDVNHNIIVESFTTGGLFLGIIMILLIIISFRKSILIIKNRDNFAWIGVLFFPLFIQSMVSGAIYLYVELWATIGALASIQNYSINTKLYYKAKSNNDS